MPRPRTRTIIVDVSPRSDSAPRTGHSVLPAWALWIAVSAAVALAIGLRLFALDSDAYARLSWSTALLTDEGFYIHNARNLVLFGVARTDQFNNMLIMPTLHGLQVLVFRTFGVGSVQARQISVWACLATLPIYYLALHRVIGRRIAAVATLLLALDHINLFYSRLALMDTPASALLICSLYAFTRGLDPVRPAGIESIQRADRSARWFFVCGLMLGLTYATRGLTALAIPAFVAAAWFYAPVEMSAARYKPLLALLSGLALTVGVFVIAWYAPNHVELARINRYYVGELLWPPSANRLFFNLATGLFDYQRGALPYLMRHSPVQFGLALCAIVWTGATRAGARVYAPTAPETRVRDSTGTALGLLSIWTGTFLIFLCCVSYAPSRYNVLFYPAMAALSAYALIEAPRIAGELIERKPLLALVGSYLLCLSGQTLRSRMTLIDVPSMQALFWSLALALFAGSQLGRRKAPPARRRYSEGAQPPEIWVSGLAIWAVINSYWLADWLLHISYRQRAADDWLALHLPANSTLIGAAAPGLCMDNRLKTAPVISGLCNDSGIVESSAPPRYIVALDGGYWREAWWDRRYPRLVAPDRRIHSFHNLLRPFFHVSIYAVDRPFSSPNAPRRP